MSTVLVVGSGGREHALAWKLASSPRVTRVIVAPGNDGMPHEWERWPVSLPQHHENGQREFLRLAQKARMEGVDLAIIGPDEALAQGIVDVFQAEGVLVLGPTQKAAQLEASKAYGKDVMRAAGVQTAAHWVLESPEEAKKLAQSLPPRGWVVKADGLALGKGVSVCETREQLLQAVQDAFSFSEKIIIEEKLAGVEVSWMAFCDGETCCLFDPARDHKRLLNHDLGPNTGGMGVISPLPELTEKHAERVRTEIFLPVLKEMKKRGTPFQGVLFAGLMWDSVKDQFSVLEFNARLGDPETQVLLPRMQGDFYTWCEATAQGDLSSMPERVAFSEEHAVYVVAASRGYPGTPEVGFPIQMPAAPDTSDRNSPYFYSAVKAKADGLVTAGGRVLGALGLGSTRAAAREKAYQNLGKVHFEGLHHRSDIGLAPVER